MNDLIQVYRRLDLIQRTNGFRWSATIFVLIMCGVAFGSLIYTSYSLETQRQDLASLLETQNLERRDVHAVTLSDSASLTYRGRAYTSDYFAQNPEWIFDDDGNVAVPVFLANDLVSDQIPGWAPTWLLDQPGTTWLLAALVTAWFLLIVWMAVSLPFVLTLLATGIPVLMLWSFGAQQAMLAVTGIGLLTFTYVLLTRVALFVLSGDRIGSMILAVIVGMPVAVGVFVLLSLVLGEDQTGRRISQLMAGIVLVGVATVASVYSHKAKQMFAVAHTVIKEASRSRISLVFIVLLLVTLPLLPIWLDPEAPLRFRIQTFISRSMNLTFVLAACMTLFLACATVAFEIRDRQIWQLMTKPMNRLSYIAGKWLGVVTVNLILLIISGVSIFTFIQYLRTLPVAPGLEGQLDSLQVSNEILTARVPTRPHYLELTPEQVRDRIEQMIDRDPDMLPEQVTMAQRRRFAEEIRNSFSASQRSIPPGRARNYEFVGLEEAKRRDSMLTLRYRFFILRDDQHETYPAAFMLNENPDTARRITYVPTMTHVQAISSEHIRDDGTLTITLANLHEPPQNMPLLGSINFEEHGFELLYKVANFEGNFFRAVIVAWTKLAFLAMLGVCCATFLSFPVSCLLSFTVFMAAALGPFLEMSLEIIRPRPASVIDWSDAAMVAEWVIQTALYFVAETVSVSLRAFGQVSSTQSLVEGRLIPWTDVAGGFLVLGVFWSGTAMLIGYLVIRSRQLAIYSGQGG